MCHLNNRSFLKLIIPYFIVYDLMSAVLGFRKKNTDLLNAFF